MINKYVQSLQLIAINGNPLLVPDIHTQLIDSYSDESDNIFIPLDLKAVNIDSSDDDSSPSPPNNDLSISKKRGRKALTAEEKDISNIFKKEYFKLYYKNNKYKYKYDKYDYNNSCIYKLIHTKTNKMYIGSTILPLHIRLKRHQTCLRNPQNKTYSEMAAISKSGWQIEPIIKVKLASKQLLGFLETIYISHHQENVFNKNKKYMPDVIACVAKLFPETYLPVSN